MCIVDRAATQGGTSNSSQSVVFEADFEMIGILPNWKGSSPASTSKPFRSREIPSLRG
jgi:hypothetical protein